MYRNHYRTQTDKNFSLFFCLFVILFCMKSEQKSRHTNNMTKNYQNKKKSFTFFLRINFFQTAIRTHRCTQSALNSNWLKGNDIDQFFNLIIVFNYLSILNFCFRTNLRTNLRSIELADRWFQRSGDFVFGAIKDI